MSEQVQRVVHLHRALHKGNWVRFFRLVAQLPYLPACLCHAFFGDVRNNAMASIIASGAAPAILLIVSNNSFGRLLLDLHNIVHRAHAPARASGVGCWLPSHACMGLVL